MEIEQVDLDKLSRKELEKLRSDVEKALKTLETRRKAEARRAAEEMAREHGFALEELVNGTKGKSRVKNAPKYRNPEDPNQTWTGRGRQPGWIKDALKQGRSIEEFEI
ncbi:H-NS histone family protein [Tranquillimonas alkanivorans]|uniref:DNA-binding protein H-NS n=1 Tax=Tranquillimonas alkanivorans TaxID=441119 RepID=A0A1I5PR04_9RHOB|nr:H-NS histone family protein [Tranquillimonas alkanivorans]SFP36455.1 DNA-binding protein H-NS [Tranquillimonas alkanivorans]